MNFMKEKFMKEELVGLILAAGKGTRLYPISKKIPKVLFEIDGHPLLLRNIELMRDKLKIKKIFIIVGYGKEQIMNRLGDGGRFGITIEYIYNSQVQKGLAGGILLAKKYINSPFCVILGDELYYKSNHSELLTWLERDFIAVCGIKRMADPHLIKKNYAVEIHNGKIFSLIEKPDIITNDYLGCGTYLFNPKIFDYIQITPISKKTQKIEIADTINIAAREEGKVYPFFLEGEYINVNNLDDLNYANYALRCEDFDKRKVSLIIPAYNEAESIKYVIDDFRGKVDEIVVIDNNSLDDTARIARERGAIVYTDTFKGYGEALRFGIEKASGDMLILTEADGSLKSRDLGKILEYLKDADMVIGTRTTKQMIEQGANMSLLLRLGNLILAKLIELLWFKRHQPRLTDVGCTYRGIWKEAYYKIKDNLKANGPEFSPEMMIELMNFNMRIIEIPVTYHGRLAGTSKFSKNLFATIKTGIRMLKLIIYKKLKMIFFN